MIASRLTREHAVLAALLALFLSRSLMADAIVPPWQGPDEPTYFTLTYRLTKPVETLAETVQGEVLVSMDRHRWWELYGRRKPHPRPKSFLTVEGVGEGNYTHPLYYGLGAAVLRTTRPADVDAAYVVLRRLSILLGLVTLVFGWAGTRLLFGAEIATASLAIGTLNPQFVLTSISVNADALLYACGAFVWWQACRVITRRQRARSIVLLLIGAAAGGLTKRIGLVLVVIAVLVVVISLITVAPDRRRRSLVAWAVGLASIIAIMASLPAFEHQLASMVFLVSDALTVRQHPGVADVYREVQTSIDTVWLAAGWMRFFPSDPWRWAARALTFAGLAGAAIVLVESSALRRPLAVAWVFVGVQTAVVLGVALWTIETAPQGRYLFPVIVPATVLLAAGWHRFVPLSLEPHWPAVLLVMLAVMDLTGLAAVLIPAYAGLASY